MVKACCIVGVDWGEKGHAWYARTREGVKRGRFDAAPESVHVWARDLRKIEPEGQIVIALEQSRGALIYALAQYEYEIVPINPRAASAYRESYYLSGAKDDPVDAELLCSFASERRTTLRVWSAEDPLTRELRLMVEQRRTLVDQRTQTLQRLTALLKQYFPQVLDWFKELDSPVARAFLTRWPSLDEAVGARRDAIRNAIRSHSRMKPDAIDGLIEKIKAATPLTTDVALIRPLCLASRSCVAMLDVLGQAIAAFDERIAELWSEHPDHEIFSSFPGAGPVMAPRLAIAFGIDRSRYADAAELQRYSGIAPVIQRSGKKTWIHARWACPTFLKQTFHEFAAASLPFCSWALAFYKQQRERGAGHHQAVRALAFRWIRVLYRCWKDRTPYNDQSHLDQLKRRGSPLATRLAA